MVLLDAVQQRRVPVGVVADVIRSRVTGPIGIPCGQIALGAKAAWHDVPMHEVGSTAQTLTNIGSGA
jgi:hypothetical protein